jgi:hypothetical protein
MKYRTQQEKRPLGSCGEVHEADARAHCVCTFPPRPTEGTAELAEQGA